MLIHLGRGVSVHDADVILLCDMTRPLSADTRTALERLTAAGRTRALGPRPKTLVMCREGRRPGRTIGYLSCVGLRTLRLRAEGKEEVRQWQTK